MPSYDTTPGRLRGRKAVERRKQWLFRFPLCEICKRQGKVTRATEVDHVVPLCKGGKDCYETNGMSICSPCHKAKTLQDMGYKEKVEIGIDGFPINQ